MAERDAIPIWLLNDATKPTYSAQEVSALTGASKHTLQNWANRGVIQPTANRPGKGGLRLYSKPQLVIIAIAHCLIPYGVEAASANYIAATIITKLLKQLKVAPGMQWKEVIRSLLYTLAVVTVKGDDIAASIIDYRNMSAAEYIKATLKPPGATIIVPCGEILAKLQSDERKAAA